jgi:hypothetical protein
LLILPGPPILSLVVCYSPEKWTTEGVVWGVESVNSRGDTAEWLYLFQSPDTNTSGWSGPFYAEATRTRAHSMLRRMNFAPIDGWRDDPVLVDWTADFLINRVYAYEAEPVTARRKRPRTKGDE